MQAMCQPLQWSWQSPKCSHQRSSSTRSARQSQLRSFPLHLFSVVLCFRCCLWSLAKSSVVRRQSRSTWSVCRWIWWVRGGKFQRNHKLTLKHYLHVLSSQIYVTLFYIYTPAKDKLAVWGKIGLAGAFIAAVVSYTIVSFDLEWINLTVI